MFVYLVNLMRRFLTSTSVLTETLLLLAVPSLVLTVVTCATSASTTGIPFFSRVICSILRAFLIEEQKIVKKVAVAKAQQKKEEAKKSAKKTTKKSAKKTGKK